LARNKTTFKPGQGKIEGAGRPKGSVSKATQNFLNILAEKNFDPGLAYVEFYFQQMKLFEEFREKYPKALVTQSEILEKAGSTLNNICQYVYPKKKAVEHSGEIVHKTWSDFIAAALPAQARDVTPLPKKTNDEDETK
jgi:hypothetical protein